MEGAGLTVERLLPCPQWRPRETRLPSPLLDDITIVYTAKP